LERAIDGLCKQVDRAIEDGYAILILSDRGVDHDNAPVPALLATAALNNHLVRERKRTRMGMVLETAEAREGHHMALLLGYGAGAINPYLAIDTIKQMVDEGTIEAEISVDEAVEHYMKACKKAVVKIMSKMGISTVRATGAPRSSKPSALPLSSSTDTSRTPHRESAAWGSRRSRWSRWNTTGGRSRRGTAAGAI
jgi:hypothetical protein